MLTRSHKGNLHNANVKDLIVAVQNAAYQNICLIIGWGMIQY